MSRYTPIVIGFAGKKRSGKDTAATLFAEKATFRGYRVVRRAFADALREEAATALAPSMMRQFDTRDLAEITQKIIAEMNDDDKKHHYRLLLQWWGTEFRRKEDDSYWLKQMDDWLNLYAYRPTPTLVLITDVRFPNEVDYIKNPGVSGCNFRGGIIRVHRPDLAQVVDEHPSETALDNWDKWDAQITNVVDLDDPQRSRGWLKESTDRLFRQLLCTHSNEGGIK
jgi:hypothetical protein